jgi:hypothetical protein
MKSSHGTCREAQKRIDGFFDAPGNTSPERFLVAEPEFGRHVQDCGGCRAVLNDALEGRRFIREHLQAAEEPGPNFTARVMEAISRQERERVPATSASPWYAVPALAARLAWGAAIVLVLASTWLYEKRPDVTPRRTAAETAGASLEPAPQPANHDEVLASLVGREP